MAITSASTEAQITAQYLDNSLFENPASVTKAWAFVEACRAMLQRGIVSSEHAGEKIEFDPKVILQMLNEAKAWIGVNGTVAAGGSGVKHADFAGFRS